MKRTFLLILLLIVSIGSVSVFASNVYKEHDNVTFQETILYGDRSAADGLNLKLHTNQSYQLFWDTTCEFDNEVAVNTDYKFYSMNHPVDSPESFFGISFMCNPDVVMYTDYTMNQAGLAGAYKELFDSLKPGEEKEKTIELLRELVDNYKLIVSNMQAHRKQHHHRVTD